MVALCGAFVSNIINLGELVVFGLRADGDLLFLVLHRLGVDRKVQRLLGRLVFAATLSCDIHVSTCLNRLEVSGLATQVFWTQSFLIDSLFIILSIG